MTKHTPYECDDKCTGCCYCDGGLILCTTCGGAEGSLTTHCPGEDVPEERLDLVFEGKLDHVNRKWWTPEESTE